MGKSWLTEWVGCDVICDPEPPQEQARWSQEIFNNSERNNITSDYLEDIQGLYSTMWKVSGSSTSDHHLLILLREVKSVCCTESKASDLNCPGGISGAFQIISGKWLNIKAACDILCNAIKRKAYYLKFGDLQFKWVHLTHLNLDALVVSDMQK